MFSTILGDIGTGVGTFLPSLATAMLQGFLALFVDTSGSTVALTPLADIAIVFIVMGLAKRFIPTIVGWFRLAASRARRKRRK